VSEQAAVHELQRCAGSDAARIEQVQRRLGCGTQCGSCLPALRVLAVRHPAAADAAAAAALTT
jgi:assimilatory nitrate reductase catalytic subunit